VSETFFVKLISQDVSADYYTAIAAIFIFLVILSRVLLVSFKKEEQSLFLIGIFGFTLSWAASGVWLSLVGTFFTIAAGAAILIRSEVTPEDTAVSVTFIRRNLFGVLIASLGACGFVSLDYSLAYLNSVSWVNHADDLVLKISVSLMLLGLLTVMIRWSAQIAVMKKNRLSALDHLLFVVALPTMASFSILIRLHSHLNEMNVFPTLAWTSIALGIILSVPVYLRKGWEEAADHIVTLIPLSAIAGYCLAGPWIGFWILFSSFIMAMAIATLRILGPNTWGKTLVVIATYGWLGGFGFVGAGGYLVIGQNLHDDPMTWSLLGLFYFLFAIPVWRILFSYCFSNQEIRPANWKWLIPTLWVLFPLGVFYTGTLSGGALAPGVDHVDGLSPDKWRWLSFFDAETKNWDDEKFLVASIVHWSLFVMTGVIAAFTRTKTKDRLGHWPNQFVKLRSWAESGFGMTWFIDSGTRVLEKMGHVLETTFSGTVWEKWIPKAVEKCRKILEDLGARVDRASNAVTSDRFSVFVRAPAKLIELTQSGNLQWYFAFGLIGSLLVLIHFIRF